MNFIPSSPKNTDISFPEDEELKKLVTNYVYDLFSEKIQKQFTAMNTLYDPTVEIEINNKIQTNVIYRENQEENLFQVEYHSEELIEKKITAEFKRNLNENYNEKENNSKENPKNSEMDIYNEHNVKIVHQN